MKYPWANVLLLFLMALEFGTGFLGLLWGAADRALALHIHRAAGFAIVIVFIWKWQNIFPSWRQWRRWNRHFVPFLAFTLLLVLVLVVLGLGLAWNAAGPFAFGPLSGLSWHVYLALPVVPFLLWHTLFHRWSTRPRFWAERRAFLRAGGLLAAGLVLWRAGEWGAGAVGLSGASRRFTGSYAAPSYSGNDFPVTSWLNDNPAPIEPQTWRLRVTGLVERAMTWTYQDLSRQREQMTATLDCTGGWYSTQEWTGIPVGWLLDQAELKPGAASITVRSVTGYYRRYSIEEARGLLLATHVGGEPLAHGHGFPVRLVAPDRRGYDWVKWVTAIEVNVTGSWLQPPLPLQ